MLRQIKGYTWIVILLEWTMSLWAQESPLVPYPISFTHFTEEEGLHQNTPYAILEDRQGFLWVGTEEGLARFDGNDFKVFQHDPGNPTSLGQNWIRDLAEDSEGNIWMGTVGGLYCYERKKEAFRDFSHLLGKAPSGSLLVSDLLMDQENNQLFFIIRENERYEIGRLSFRDSSHQSLRFDSLSRGEGWTARSLVIKGDSLYAATSRHLLTIALSNLQLKVYHFPRLPEKLSIGGLSEGRGPYLWLHNAGFGLWRFHTSTQQLQHIPTPYPSLNQSTITQILPDQQDQKSYWLATDGQGLFNLRFEEGDRVRAYLYQHQPKRVESLANNRIISLHQDRNGNLWVGTSTSLDLYAPQREAFKHITQEVLPELAINSFLSVRSDHNNNLWLGTADGLYRLQARYPDRPWSSFLSLTEATQTVRRFPSMKGKYVRSLFVDAKGQVWAGSKDASLTVFSPAGDLIRSFSLPSFDQKPRLNSMPNAMAPGTDGSLVLAQELRMSIFDPGSAELTDLQAAWDSCMSSQFQGISPHVLDVHRDAAGNYWFATFQGLFCWRVVSGCFEAAADPEQTADEIPSRCMAVIPDPLREERLWIGALGEGLFCYDKKTKRYRRYIKADGLANSSLLGLVADEKGNIWMSSNGGISVFNPKQNTFQNYQRQDGLVTNEFNKIAFHRSHLGEMFWGTDQGLVMFHPDQLPQPRGSPQVVLTRLQVNYEEAKIGKDQVLQQAISFTQKLELGPTKKVITLEFAALDLLHAAQLNYAYQLEGFDPNWVFTDARHRRATYSNLPAGTYHFRVKASDRQGNFPEEALSLEIVVKPPFWKRGWFVALCLLALIGGVAGAVRYYSQRKLRAQMKETENQHRIQIERERIARDLHDNIGARLASMIYKLDQLTDELKAEHPEALDTERSQQFDKLYEHTQGTIAQLRQTIWTMNQQRVTLGDFESRLRRFCWDHLSHAAAPDFSIEVEVDEKQELSPLQALGLFRILQESLSNVLKHSHAEKLSLRLIQDPRGLQLEIVDNGRGFDPKVIGEGEHYGLRNFQERVGEMKGEWKLHSQPGKGTHISIRLPKEQLPPPKSTI